MANEPSNDPVVALIQRPLPDTSNLPAIRLSDPAAEFIDNRIDASDHRAFSRSSLQPKSAALSTRRSTSSPPSVGLVQAPENPLELYQTSDREQKLFLAAIEKFENDLPEKYKTKFDVKGKHSWEEVINEAKIAEMKYKKKGSEDSPFSKVRGSFRKLQSRAGALSTWLEYIPQSTYSSVVSGSFKVIIRAATRMNEIRDFVFDAMASIPEEIERVQLVMVFNHDMTMSSRLHQRMAELYVAILQILHHIVMWLERKSGIKHLKAFLQQGEYERALEIKVDNFKRLVVLVKEEANLCASQRLQQMDRKIDDLADQFGRQMGALSTQVDRLLAAAQQRSKNQAEVLEGLHALHALYGMLKTNPQLDPKTGQRLLPGKKSVGPPERTKKAIPREALMDELDYDADILTDDLTTVLRWGNDLSLKEQDRAVHILRHPKLKEWLMMPNNTTLLINGNEPEVSSRAVHATSFITAHLVNSIAATPHMVGMYWFCGLHKNTKRDENANVRRIVAFLSGQLLAQYKGFDLYFFKRRHLLAIRDDNLEALCNLLDELLCQVPEGTIVYCVLDWLSCLEFGSAATAEVKYLVERLLRVAANPLPRGCKFKFVVVNPGGPFRAARLFGREDTLTEPEQVDGDGTGFNKMMWKMKVTDPMRESSRRSRRPGLQ